MIIFCSKKLETFLGQKIESIEPTKSSTLGNWNAHLFNIERKKYLLFMNNKTCYSVLLSHVLKKDILNLKQLFKERLIQQLDFDIQLNTEQKAKLTNELLIINFYKTNNDKKIIGTINNYIDQLSYKNSGDWDDLIEASILNNGIVGTKILPDKQRKRDYFMPIDLMKKLLQ